MLLIPDTCVIELLNLDIDTFGKLTLQSTKFLHRFLECESCCSSVLQREVHSSGKLTLSVALWRKSVIVSSFPKVSMSKLWNPNQQASPSLSGNLSLIFSNFIPKMITSGNFSNNQLFLGNIFSRVY